MMTINNLKTIIEELGFREISPSAELLAKLGITRLRFFQILKNEGKKELTVLEKEKIENWLCELTGKSAEEIDLLGTNKRKEEDELAKDLKLS
jgi:hypothetical protein